MREACVSSTAEKMCRGKDVVVIETAERKRDILGHVDTFERY